jgi:hypothetical protein
MTKMKLDYNDKSVIRVWNTNDGVDGKVREFNGLAGVEEIFSEWFAIRPNTCVDLPIIHVNEEERFVFITVTWPCAGFSQWTDTFWFDADGMILRQNVAYTKSAAGAPKFGPTTPKTNATEPTTPKTNATKPPPATTEDQVKVEYTIASMPGNLSKMTPNEKDDITSQIKTEAEKAVPKSSAKVVLTQDSATRRRDSHTGMTFSATVTVTFPAGTTYDEVKAAFKKQPAAELTYTVGGDKKTHKVDYAKVAENLKDLTLGTTTTTPSSATTVLSTVATVLVATVAALF